MARRPDFDAMISVHKLLNELPKASEVFIKYREKDFTLAEVIDGTDSDGLAQLVIFTERLHGLNIPKSWRSWVKDFHRKAAHRLALNARNPLDRLAEVRR
jgi:hypothetical protein